MIEECKNKGTKWTAGQRKAQKEREINRKKKEKMLESRYGIKVKGK